MKDKYSPLLLSGKGKAVVLLGAAGLLAAGIYGVTQVHYGDFRLRSAIAVLLLLLERGGHGLM